MTTDDARSVAEEIDSFIRQQLWFDFDVISYGSCSLTIGGGITEQRHNLEICFEDVFVVSMPMSW